MTTATTVKPETALELRDLLDIVLSQTSHLLDQEPKSTERHAALPHCLGDLPNARGGFPFIATCRDKEAAA